MVPNLECNKYFCCEKCFNDYGDSVKLMVSPDSDVVVDVEKSLFSDLLNSETLEEGIECERCHKTWHKVCALHIDDIWGKRFICLRCGVRKHDQLRSANLPHCDMSRFIQERVDNWQQMEQTNLKINIRVLSISNKSAEIKPEMRRIFMQNGGMPENLPYKSKSIFAFQEQPDDGSEICLFGMHTQEYGSDCPSPNTRLAYISYLDSVNFFQPPQLRTDFYHRLLISYLEYCSQLGFVSVHIWACPPEGETEYIFRGHPTNQQVPTPEKLKNCDDRIRC